MNTAGLWYPAYIGVGSNLEGPAAQVRNACDALAELPESRLVATSALYANPPMGPQDQPDYINAVAALLTRLAPHALLDVLKEVERNQGRVRTPGDRWGARIIDLDLLIYGSANLADPGLTIPHPGISERNFVLFPLLDIAPSLIVMGQGPVAAMTQLVDGATIQKIAE